jgi:hypothetical protein
MVIWAAATTVFGAAEAGHESPVYPSFYPQEIRIEQIEPADAGEALARGRIQAYVGSLSGLPAGSEKSLKSVLSLGSFLIVRVNAATAGGSDASGRCALAQSVISALARDAENFHFHPYPVTSLHPDYFHHFDLAAAARTRFGTAPASAVVGPRVRAVGALAERLVPARIAPAAAGWDASVEEVDLDGLMAAHRFTLNGWIGPPWLKEGWFHAYLLLGGALADGDPKRRADAIVARLQGGTHTSRVEMINLERELLALLTGDCRMTVAGHATQRWYYNDDYSLGIENLAFDSHDGFRSAIFIRTVKLKDFPWNGWLALGVPSAAAAAWNPLGGLTDGAGRLIWLALGDPAMFPEPYKAGWSVNRIGSVKKADK